MLRMPCISVVSPRVQLSPRVISLRGVRSAQKRERHVLARNPVARIEIKGPASSNQPSIAEPSSITLELIENMKTKISTALEAEKVQIIDVNGDGRHVAIDVVSKLFEGESSMQRQRMVYKAIWFELQEAVHAVDAMTTKTPKEAGL